MVFAILWQKVFFIEPPHPFDISQIFHVWLRTCQNHIDITNEHLDRQLLVIKKSYRVSPSDSENATTKATARQAVSITTNASDKLQTIRLRSIAEKL
jgi:hypothetical protein